MSNQIFFQHPLEDIQEGLEDKNKTEPEYVIEKKEEPKEIKVSQRQQEKEKRLQKALRDNLRKRKEQKRIRDHSASSPCEEDPQ